MANFVIRRRFPLSINLERIGGATEDSLGVSAVVSLII